MMAISIRKAQCSDFVQLLAIWEASVRATHDFITEETIQALKPLILNEYFPAVALICSLDENNQITGFAGSAAHKLEMLFIDPAYSGKGIGKSLLNYAINQQGVTSVDVNEQNPQAVGFYLKQGFKIIGRSEKDGQGKPYPLLHMQYSA